MITFTEINERIEVALETGNFFNPLKSPDMFQTKVLATIDTLDLSLLSDQYKKHIISYHFNICEKRRKGEIIYEHQLEGILNVLKLKYLRYLQYSESENKIN